MSEEKKEEYMRTVCTYDEAKQILAFQGYSDEFIEYWLAHWKIPSLFGGDKTNG